MSSDHQDKCQNSEGEIEYAFLVESEDESVSGTDERNQGQGGCDSGLRCRKLMSRLSRTVAAIQSEFSLLPPLPDHEDESNGDEDFNEVLLLPPPPPAPIVKLINSGTELKWTMPELDDTTAEAETYEIYVYSVPFGHNYFNKMGGRKWELALRTPATSLPMTLPLADILGKKDDGSYCIVARGVDEYDRFGPFSSVVLARAPTKRKRLDVTVKKDLAVHNVQSQKKMGVNQASFNGPRLKQRPFSNITLFMDEGSFPGSEENVDYSFVSVPDRAKRMKSGLVTAGENRATFRVEHLNDEADVTDSSFNDSEPNQNDLPYPSKLRKITSSSGSSYLVPKLPSEEATLGDSGAGVPPAPKLKMCAGLNGTPELMWTVPGLKRANSQIRRYEIYVYEKPLEPECSSAKEGQDWMCALSLPSQHLPMKCRRTLLGKAQAGRRYFIAVRAIGVNYRPGPFSPIILDEVHGKDYPLSDSLHQDVAHEDFMDVSAEEYNSSDSSDFDEENDATEDTFEAHPIGDETTELLDKSRITKWYDSVSEDSSDDSSGEAMDREHSPPKPRYKGSINSADIALENDLFGTDPTEIIAEEAGPSSDSMCTDLGYYDSDGEASEELDVEDEAIEHPEQDRAPESCGSGDMDNSLTDDDLRCLKAAPDGRKSSRKVRFRSQTFYRPLLRNSVLSPNLCNGADVWVNFIEEYRILTVTAKADDEYILNMLRQIQIHAPAAPGLQKMPSWDEILIAPAGDGYFYRARVVDCATPMVEVEFIEYGDRQRMHYSKLKELGPEASGPIYGIQFCLKDVPEGLPVLPQLEIKIPLEGRIQVQASDDGSGKWEGNLYLIDQDRTLNDIVREAFGLPAP